jgi:hypothetical protein
VSALNLVFLAGIAAIFMRIGEGDTWFGLPSILPVILCIPFVALVPAFGLPIAAAWAWRKGYWSLRKRLQFSIIAAGALGFIPYLYHWNLLGFRY